MKTETRKKGEIKTKRELLQKLKALGDISEEQKKSVVCSLIGHSRIQSHFFGYYNCGRCEEKLGDSLAGCYSGESVVIIGHKCKTCEKNYAECTWKDTFMCPDPFAEEAK